MRRKEMNQGHVVVSSVDVLRPLEQWERKREALGNGVGN